MHIVLFPMLLVERAEISTAPASTAARTGSQRVATEEGAAELGVVVGAAHFVLVGLGGGRRDAALHGAAL